jgi:hypothetical protein
MRIATVTLVTLGALSLVACSASSDPSAAGKYKQTWTTPYSDTACADYLNAMSKKQRWVMAADMLASVRKVDGGSQLPSDGQVDRFQADVATGCEGEATEIVGDVAVAIYKLDASYQP